MHHYDCEQYWKCVEIFAEAVVNDMSTVDQVKAWCHQATSHYLICKVKWIRSLGLNELMHIWSGNCAAFYYPWVNHILMGLCGRNVTPLLITVPADALVPNGARASAGTMISTIGLYLYHQPRGIECMELDGISSTAHEDWLVFNYVSRTYALHI